MQDFEKADQAFQEAGDKVANKAIEVFNNEINKAIKKLSEMKECLPNINNKSNKKAWEKLIEMHDFLERAKINKPKKQEVETIFTEFKKAVENYV